MVGGKLFQYLRPVAEKAWSQKLDLIRHMISLHFLSDWSPNPDAEEHVSIQ